MRCIYRSVVLSLVSLDFSLPAVSIDSFHFTTSAHGFAEMGIFFISPRMNNILEKKNWTSEVNKALPGIFIFKQFCLNILR